MICILPITTNSTSQLMDARKVVDDFMIQNYNQTVVRLPNGRPTIKDAQISISHTVNRVAIMVSDVKCGIDIEAIDRKTAHIASRFAAPNELEVITKVYPHNPTLLIWCAKEAAFKWAQKDGVDFLKNLKISSASENQITMTVFDDTLNLKWHIEDQLLVVVTSLL